jgi:hypothetical protein
VVVKKQRTDAENVSVVSEVPDDDLMGERVGSAADVEVPQEDTSSTKRSDTPERDSEPPLRLEEENEEVYGDEEEKTKVGEDAEEGSFWAELGSEEELMELSDGEDGLTSPGAKALRKEPASPLFETRPESRYALRDISLPPRLISALYATSHGVTLCHTFEVSVAQAPEAIAITC